MAAATCLKQATEVPSEDSSSEKVTTCSQASDRTTFSQASEVAEIKAAHPGHCRVVKNVGEFTHVVTIQPQDMDVTLKFQLKALYPNKVPVISVRSGGLSEEEILELTQILKGTAGGNLNMPMIKQLVDKAVVWLTKNGMKSGKTAKPANPLSVSPKNRKQKKGKPKEEDIDTKLPSMKTAEDVIKRIMWDDSLQADDFLVGYLDRFKGIMEKYFSAFSWEDIATVDYNVLAIPKHRIQYFKYRDIKVWDKLSRLDNVFGSTGSKLTITDVINKYEAENLDKEAERGHDDEEEISGLTHDYNGDSDEGDDSDDSDDGIHVTFAQNTFHPTASSSVAGATYAAEPDDQAYEYGDDDGHTFWEDKLRPNYFFAVRITDPEILKGVEEVTDFILDHEPNYGECCIPQASLHITLCTVGLNIPEHVTNAVKILQARKAELSSMAPKEPLKLEGVSTFYNRVVYAKVHYPQSFLDFVNHLKLCLKEEGIDIRDGYDFIPHMTIMKTTRPVSRRMGRKNIDSWLYQGYSDMYFGTQKVDGLYLSSMGSDRREDGFYVSPGYINFTN